eukprot:gene25297-27391_t
MAPWHSLRHSDIRVGNPCLVNLRRKIECIALGSFSVTMTRGCDFKLFRHPPETLPGSPVPAPNRLYLDYNATAPLRDEARTALLAALDHPGNASSVHMEGRDARARIEAARTAVARLAGGSAKGVVFTSGATEANVTALTSAWIRGGRDVSATHLL